MSDTPALEARAVDRSYGHGRHRVEVVGGCSFAVERHRLTVMIGPSGVGKSTLVRLLAGFEKPTHGTIWAGGRRVDGPGRDRLVVFQESALFPWMTVRENVAYGPRARGEWSGETRAAGERLLETVRLRGFGDRFPGQLSGGMQRLAELARALANRPTVMILDEPFRGLDAMTRQVMLEHYAGLCDTGARTDLFVTTDIDEALFLADRLLIMSQLPTRVRAEIEVDLPRPRRLAAMVGDERANRLKREALALLHEEALKAFTGCDRATTDVRDFCRYVTPPG